MYGSNQNSSADRLGLNHAGLTKWEKQFMRGYFKPYLNADFLLKGNALVRAMLLWTQLTDQENSYRVLRSFGCSFFEGEQESLDNYSGYKGKTEHFWCLEQASRTRHVLEATSSITPSVVQASGRLVSTFFRVSRTYFMLLGEFSKLTD